MFMKKQLLFNASIFLVAVSSVFAAQITAVFQNDVHQFTGVAISKRGRMFVNFPRWQEPHQYDLVKVLTNNEVRPYPDANWNRWAKGTAGSNHWVCVQAVYVDDRDRLWVVDPAAPEMKKVQDNGAKVVTIDLNTDSVWRTYNLTSLVSKNSYLKDIRVDCDSGTAYLTESKNGGIVVLQYPCPVTCLIFKGRLPATYIISRSAASTFTAAAWPIKSNLSKTRLMPERLSTQPSTPRRGPCLILTRTPSPIAGITHISNSDSRARKISSNWRLKIA
jgi:hypothetical protein